MKTIYTELPKLMAECQGDEHDDDVPCLSIAEGHDEEGKHIATLHDIEVAAEIAMRCNAFPALVEALRELKTLMVYEQDGWDGIDCTQEEKSRDIEAAVAAAEAALTLVGEPVKTK